MSSVSARARVVIGIAVCAVAAFAQLTASIALEPTLIPQQGKLAVETDFGLAYSITSRTSVGTQFGYSDSLCPLREYLFGAQYVFGQIRHRRRSWSRSQSFFVTGQGGEVDDHSGRNPILVVGSGVSWELDNGWSVSAALDINKQQGAAVWPSAVVGVSKTFELGKSKIRK